MATHQNAAEPDPTGTVSRNRVRGTIELLEGVHYRREDDRVVLIAFPHEVTDLAVCHLHGQGVRVEPTFQDMGACLCARCLSRDPVSPAR